MTGLRVSAETTRRSTEQAGLQIEQVKQAAMASVIRTDECLEKLEPAPGEWVIETDGVTVGGEPPAMVRFLDGWHEVKLGLVGGQVADQLTALSHLAARETAERFGPRLLAEATRRGALEVVGWQGPLTSQGLGILRKVVIIGDGAPWIWNLASEYFGERIEIVDYYHATEHIWNLAHAFYGEGTPKAYRWATRQKLRLLSQGVKPFLRALRKAKPINHNLIEQLRRELAYF